MDHALTESRVDPGPPVTSAHLADAIGRLHTHRAHILDLVSPNPGRRLFGPAATIAFLPVRTDILDPDHHNFGRLFYVATGDRPAGKVLVCATYGHADASIGGGIKLSRLQNHGLAGLLTDGRVRDFDELQTYAFATWCRGPTPRWGTDMIMPFAADVPVSLAGVTIMPGDYVYADACGAVVIPRADIDQTLADAQRIVVEDADWIARIAAESPAAIRRAGSTEV